MKKLWVLLLTVYLGQLSGAVYLEPTPQFKPRVEIAAIYIEYQDLILILHRHKHKTQGNRWGIPGGKVDKGETPLQAVVRETKEETGYDLSEQPIEPVATVYVEHTEKDHIVYHMFRTQLQGDPGAVKVNFNEHKGFTWVTLADGAKMDLIQDEAACFELYANYLKN